MGRKIRGIAGFLRGFNDGYQATNKIVGAFAMGDAANASPETIETQTLGAETTPNTEGKVYDSDTGQYLPKYLNDSGLPTEQAQAQLNAPADGASEAPTGVTPTFATDTVRQYRMGGKTQDQPFTADQIWQSRLRAMGDVSARYGNPVQSAQFLGLAARRREDSDEEEIRNLLARNHSRGLERVPVGNTQAGTDAQLSPVGAPSDVPGLSRTQSYLETVSPRITDAYLRQGKVAEAKAWNEFAESQQGRDYSNDYARAQRLVTTGDYDAAAPVLEGLYNRGYPDGRQAKLTSIGDGNYKVDVYDQTSGKVIGSKTMPAADMGKLAIGALSPTKMVEFTVQQQAKRDSERATVDRQIQLETLRQQGQEGREDRRDERTRMQLDAMDKRLGRQLAARGGLTATQDRGNAEIDAAREAVAGMDPAEVRRLTAKATSTGRENPDYRPDLARAASLAGRRKVGADDWFDQRQGRPQLGDTFAGKPLAELTDGQLQQYGRAAGSAGKANIDAEVARRSLANMPEMRGHQIGPYVEGKGYQVLDPQGRPVSYLRRRAQ